MITFAEIYRRLEEIEAIRHDDESAHALEDRLRDDVLAAIAEGADHAGDLAALVRTSHAIHFARWCA